MLRDDVRELRRVVDQALRNGEECWPVLPDGVGSGDSETFRLIEGTVNEASGVTAGATFNIDNVRPLAGGVNPAASTADGVNVEIELATGNYTDNQTPIRAIRDDDNARWIDVTDQSGDSTPQTYNVKLQAALTKAATSVSVKWLDASLVEVGSAFTAYDPHAQFSSGYGITDALGRVALVADADTGAERWELTHLVSLARYVKGTLAENEGATTAGKASCTSYTAYGNGWHETSPVGTINFVGLSGQKTGDTVVGVLVDPDATLPEYLAVEVPAGTDVFLFENTGTDVAVGASGTMTLQTTSGCTPSDGDSVTVCNTKTTGTIWTDSFGVCYKAPDGAYIAIASDAATLFEGTAAGDSNADNSHTSFTSTSFTPRDGTHSGSGTFTIANPLSLEINTGDTVIFVATTAGNARAVNATADRPGCGLKRNSSDSHEWEVDSSIFGSGLTVTEVGDCFEVTAASYSAGCGIDLASGEISVDRDDLIGSDIAVSQSGLEPGTASDCGIQVATQCGVKIADTAACGEIGKVMFDAVEVADRSHGTLISDGCCGLIAQGGDHIYQYFEENVDLFVNLVIQKLMENYGSTVTVLKECQGITADSSQLTITYTTTELTVLAVGSDGTDDSCVFDVTASCGTGA